MFQEEKDALPSNFMSVFGFIHEAEGGGGVAPCLHNEALLLRDNKHFSFFW